MPPSTIRSKLGLFHQERIMKLYLFSLIILTLALSGCQQDAIFINHPRPDLAVDFTPFEDAGCPPDEYGRMYCEADSPLGALGCDLITKPSDLFGGLQPADPIARCTIEPFLDQEPGEEDFPEEGTYFYNVGGLYPRFIRYVVYTDGGFELIQNPEQFRAYFAPNRLRLWFRVDRIQRPDNGRDGLGIHHPLYRHECLRFHPQSTHTQDQIRDRSMPKCDSWQWQALHALLY